MESGVCLLHTLLAFESPLPGVRLTMLLCYMYLHAVIALAVFIALVVVVPRLENAHA